ncbi:MAG TPA: ribonuclease III [candidate division Zixibacteria bacterium]|nr:ribonuclease III [candidate division Zixibacteria bacterium]
MGLFDSLRRLFSNKDEFIENKLNDQFCNRLGYRFKDPGLLIEALTHRSYIRNNGADISSNERLEFLGDSILGLLVAEYLFKTCPGDAEGDMTKTKAMLVNENTLSKAGQSCGLNQLIFLSDDEEKSGGRQRNSIVSDAMEATIGAIYLDGGLKAARAFILQTIITHMEEALADEDQYNYKGELLELLQGRGEKTPYYEVISEKGPDHAKTFEVAVHAGGDVTGIGSGPSKKEAEQKAAAKALAIFEEMENSKKTDSK